MGKHKLAYAMSAVALIAGGGIFAPATFAEEITTVGTAEELAAAVLDQAPYIKVTSDITASSCVNSDSGWLGYFDITTTLDLDGHTITQAEGCLDFYVRDGGDLTITGGGKIVKGYQDGNSDVFYVIGDESRGGGRLTIEDAEIDGDGYAIRMTGPGTELNVNGGKLKSNGYGVAAFGPAAVTVDGGEIDAETFALTGNGLSENAGAAFYIKSGRVVSNTDYAIYLPQVDGVLEVTGGEIIGAAGAIAANRGTINITGGKIVSLGTAVVSGDVSQDGTRGYGNAVIGIAKEYGPVTLSISGGIFDNQNGAELIADVSGLDNENEATVEITGGQFTAAPDESEIVDGMEAEAEDGVWTIYPKQIDYNNDWLESDSSIEGQISAAVEFGSELIADRKATLSVAEKNAENLTLNENKGGELIGAFEIDMLDRDGSTIEVKNNALVVYIDLDEETHAMLSAYDELYAVYFENGVEAERFEVTLSNPENGYWLSFETPHLSTYGIVGVNSDDSETSGGAAASDAAAAPETGTMTAAGASATGAAMVTAVAVGILTSVVSFVYLMRRR